MDNQLHIIDPEELKSVSPKEIDRIITKIVASSKDNYQEIENLTLESVSLLTSAQTRSNALAGQKTFKRLWNNFTGKNDKLRNAITQDTAAAQYAAQQSINRVLAECSNNQRLALAVNDRLSALVAELQTGQEEITNDVARARKMIVALYQDYDRKIKEQAGKLDELENVLGEKCFRCRRQLRPNQIVCPYCGEIHSMKAGKLPVEIQDQLKFLSGVVEQDEWDTRAYWDAAADRFAKALLKAQSIAGRGTLRIPDALQKDIANLIEKCRNAEFQIAVVGVLKAGKSMLMNALIGEDLASTGLNSETAALTKFRSSPKGHYIQVNFYSKEEWDKLNASARESQRGGESGDDSLRERLKDPTVQKAARKWIGHAPIREEFPGIPELRDRIRHWTSAKSDDHLFAAEVEVGIDRTIFQMPEEVVFVDTPGLQDPVKYRSRITMDYIGKANAVLVAVRPMALTNESFGTITTVLDHAGTNKKKVYIIGTQKDSLNTSDDYDVLIHGTGGWIEQLVQAGRYKNKREATRQILTTSAYLQLCMNKALKLSEKEFEDPERFSDDEYADLQRGITKALGKRGSYSLENLRSDPDAQREGDRFFGISQLMRRLEKDLISQFRVLKIQDIQEDYMRCRKELLQAARGAESQQAEVIKTARLGAEELRKRLLEKERAREELKREQDAMKKALADLRALTERHMEKVKRGSAS